MRYAILSDVHGRREKLASVLDDARSRGATQIISLGDVGWDSCLALLKRAGALAVFGNYEVSGWRRLGPEHRAWVQGWMPLLAEDGFLGPSMQCPGGPKDSGPSTILAPGSM